MRVSMIPIQHLQLMADVLTTSDAVENNATNGAQTDDTAATSETETDDMET
jgi:hypothetical protein